MSEELVKLAEELEGGAWSRSFTIGERAKRVARLTEIITDYIGGDILEGDGGWTPVPTEHQRLIEAILREIVELKVARDCDGDQTINIYVENRQHGRLNVVQQPYVDYDKLNPTDLETHNRQIAQMMDAAASHNAYAKDIMDHAIRLQRGMEDELNKKRKIIEAIETYDRRFEDYALTKTLIEEWSSFCRDHRSHTDDEIAEAFNRVRARNIERYPEDFAASVRRLNKRMSHFQHDEQDNFYRMVTEPRLVFRYLFGKQFSDAIAPLAQKLSDAGRAIRLHKRACKDGRVVSLVSA